MALDRITLSTFRNHRSSRLEGTGRLNLLVGENGAGKTNVLEAISLFAPGRGLRRAALPEMAASVGQNDSQDRGFAVSALLDPGDGAEPVRIGTGIDPARPGRRIVHVNEAEASAASLGEWLAIGWLTPAMDRLFADSASARRRYMDRLALALDPAHARIAARYEAALRERNRLLAEEREAETQWLDAIEAQLAEAGAALAAGRALLVERLSAELAALPEQPFARPALAYLHGGPMEAEALAAALRGGRARDRAAQRTLTGPHRDELEVTMAESGAGTGRPAAQCSTGEQKALLIGLVLAQARLATKLSGETPLVLLDEIAAHLDETRRQALFRVLDDLGCQAFMTGTDAGVFAALGPSAMNLAVDAGHVRPL